MKTRKKNKIMTIYMVVMGLAIIISLILNLYTQASLNEAKKNIKTIHEDGLSPHSMVYDNATDILIIKNDLQMHRKETKFPPLFSIGDIVSVRNGSGVIFNIKGSYSYYSYELMVNGENTEYYEHTLIEFGNKQSNNRIYGNKYSDNIY